MSAVDDTNTNLTTMMINSWDWTFSIQRDVNTAAPCDSYPFYGYAYSCSASGTASAKGRPYKCGGIGRYTQPYDTIDNIVSNEWGPNYDVRTESTNGQPAAA